MIQHSAFAVEPWAVRETELHLGPARPDRVGLRAGQRPPRAARQPRRGRAVRPARHLPERVLRAAPAPVRRGGLRLPRGRPDDRQRHQRQAHPAARRRRAVRRPLRRAAQPRAGARPARGRAATARRVESRRPDGRCGSRRCGWSRSCSAPSRRSSTRSRRSRAGARWSCSRSWWPTSRCPTSSGDPRAAAALGRAAVSAELHVAHGGARRARALDQAERAADGGRHGSRRGRPGRTSRPTPRAAGDLARVLVTADARARPAAAARQVPRLRLVERSARCRALRDQVGGRARRGAATRAGRASLRRPARVPGRLLGPRRRRARGRRGAPAGGALRAVPHAPGRRAGRAARDRGQGPDRARATTATRSGTPRRSCCRCSPTPSPHAAADALRWRHSTPRPRPRARRASSACAAPPSPGARSTARSAPATGRPARRRSTSTPTSPTPSIRYSDATGDQAFEREVGLELLVETARLWRSLGHHEPDGRFRIDGVTGPDEYSAIADNNVYTNLMAQRNLRAAADAAAAPPATAPPSSASSRRRSAGWRDAADGDARPLRRGARRAPAGRGVHRARASGTSRAPAPISTRCCCTSPTSTCTASRSSSRPTSCSRCTCAATPSPTRRRRATSTTTSGSPSATPRSRRAPRR